MNKTFLAFIAVVCLALGGFAGYSLAPTQTQTFQAAGDTASSAKIAQVVLDLSTTTPTTVGGACKLYNADARDRIINAITFDLAGLGTMTGATGAGVATLNWIAGTSTAANIYTVTGNNVLNTTVATSSPYLYVASTTPGLTGTAVNRLWLSGTCLNLFTNATSSTATGNIRVDYSQGF